MGSIILMLLLTVSISASEDWVSTINITSGTHRSGDYFEIETETDPLYSYYRCVEDFFENENTRLQREWGEARRDSDRTAMGLKSRIPFRSLGKLRNVDDVCKPESEG